MALTLFLPLQKRTKLRNREIAPKATSPATNPISLVESKVEPWTTGLLVTGLTGSGLQSEQRDFCIVKTLF